MMRFCIKNIRYENFATILAESDDNGSLGTRRPEGSTTGYDGKVRKIVGGRRRFRFPFQSARLPRIISCPCSGCAAAQCVGDKDESSKQNDKDAGGRRKVGAFPTQAGNVSVNSPCHSNHAKPV